MCSPESVAVMCNTYLIPEATAWIAPLFYIAEAIAWGALVGLVVLTVVSLAFKVALVLHRIVP